MNCPICLYGLTLSVVFGCGHSCCQRCVEASEIEKCPVCREKITSTTPSPWLDSSNSDDSSNSNDSSEVGTVKYYFSKPVLDFRGYILRQGYCNLLNYSTEHKSNVPSIIERGELEILRIKQAHDIEIKKLEKKLQETIDSKNRETQALVEEEETKIKEQDYRNQGFSHLAMTFLALSIQPAKVLDQALPVYQSKLNWFNHRWALGILPYKPGKRMNGEHYLYVEQHNDYFYSLGSFIMFNGKAAPSLHPIVRVKYHDNLFYVMRKKDHKYSMYMYDINLELVNILPCADKQIDFYMQGNLICPVFEVRKAIVCEKDSRKLIEVPHCRIMFNDNVIKFTGIIENIEVIGNVLYIHDSGCGRTYMYDETGKCTTKECKFLAYPDHVVFYEHDRDMLETIVTMPDKTTKYLDGHGTFYPNANNTVIYRVKELGQYTGTLYQLF